MPKKQIEESTLYRHSISAANKYTVPRIKLCDCLNYMHLVYTLNGETVIKETYNRVNPKTVHPVHVGYLVKKIPST